MSETTVMDPKDPKNPHFIGPCPRCGEGVPNSITPGAYPGALSRLDNQTYICSSCGQAEAMFNFLNRGMPLPPLDELVRL